MIGSYALKKIATKLLKFFKKNLKITLEKFRKPQNGWFLWHSGELTQRPGYHVRSINDFIGKPLGLVALSWKMYGSVSHLLTSFYLRRELLELKRRSSNELALTRWETDPMWDGAPICKSIKKNIFPRVDRREKNKRGHISNRLVSRDEKHTLSEIVPLYWQINKKEYLPQSW